MTFSAPRGYEAYVASWQRRGGKQEFDWCHLCPGIPYMGQLMGDDIYVCPLCKELPDLNNRLAEMRDNE